jgi:hypothetical protein
MANHSDRNTIRQVCNLMGLIYRDQWYETDNFITIPAWGRRFWFKTQDDVEYIENPIAIRKALHGNGSRPTPIELHGGIGGTLGDCEVG